MAGCSEIRWRYSAKGSAGWSKCLWTRSRLSFAAVRRGDRAGSEAGLRFGQRIERGPDPGSGEVWPRRACPKRPDGERSFGFRAVRDCASLSGAQSAQHQLSPDGAKLYVANRLDDTISVIDTEARRGHRHHPAGRAGALTPERRGERLFYSSMYSFGHQFGCANCHLDATFDGLSWDLEPDGFGMDIVDNRAARRNQRHRALQMERQ